MDEEILNMSLRKFLKKLGVTAQREIEQAVREAVAAGRLKGDETLRAEAVVRLEGTALSLTVDGEISLK
jgi:hypothetical protein